MTVRGAGTEITAFSFTSPAATGTISGTAIAVTVPYGTDVTGLIPTVTHTGASYTPTGAQNFTSPVTYTVTAADGSTQAYTVTVTAGSPPGAVAMYEDMTQHFTVNSGSSISIRWGAVPGATSYKVYYRSPDAGAWVTVPANGEGNNSTPTTTFTHTGASYTPTGAQDFTGPVTYTVTAADGSTQAYTVTAGSPPGAVQQYDDFTQHFTVNSGSSISIRWGAVPGATSYKVYYALADSGAFVYIPANGAGNNSTATTTFTHTGLDQGTRYSYWITAVNAYGESPLRFTSDDNFDDGYIGWVETIIDHIPAPVRPKIDEDPAVEAYPGPMISLRWLPSPGATKYRAYYRVNDTGDYNLITFRNIMTGVLFIETTETVHYHGYEITPTDTHYLAPNTTYYYYIAAGNDFGFSDKEQGYIGHATTGAN
jgi:hypothetical protein